MAATTAVTVFLIALSRSSQAAVALLGSFQGVLVSDRWNAYRVWAVGVRQLCWAHLKRDFEAFAQRPGASKRIGKKLLKEVEIMFTLWHRVRDGTLARSTFRGHMGPVRRRIEEFLERGKRSRDGPLTRKCAKILELKKALWTFVRVEGVEPTNNFGERQIRHAVQYRKVCFGTHSPAGSRFVERMLTAVMTLQQQNRSVMDYLTLAARAAIEGKSAPSLLPPSRAQTVAA